MSASFCCVSCIAPIGLPKARRVLLYSSADSKQARAAPMAPQPIPKRASLRHDSGPRMPVTSGSTALSGRRTESNDSSEVTDARSESLLCTSDVVKPRVPRSTRNPRTPRVGRRPHHGDVGHRAVGDPHLGAVEHPVITVAPRRGAHRRGIRSRVRLGEPEAADGAAGGHLGQPARLLLVAAVRPDREHRERALHGHEGAQAAVAGLELLGRDPVGGRRRSGAAVAVEVHAEQTELGDLRDQLAREGPGFEVLRDHRQRPLADEGADGVADQALVVAEQVVDGEEVGREQAHVSAERAR